jgi:hypothetical protein
MSETGVTFRLSSVYSQKSRKGSAAVIIKEIFPETKFKNELDLLSKRVRLLESIAQHSLTSVLTV